jgi:hypothetical protein
MYNKTIIMKHGTFLRRLSTAIHKTKHLAPS